MILAPWPIIQMLFTITKIDLGLCVHFYNKMYGKSYDPCEFGAKELNHGF